MSLQTKGLCFFKHKIISYYDELINKIDVKTEEFLFQKKTLKTEKIDEINAKRNVWIERIEIVREKNILNLEKNADLETLNWLTDDEERLNNILFENEFLIFSQNAKFSKFDPLFIGKLIQKNGYWNKDVVYYFE